MHILRYSAVDSFFKLSNISSATWNSSVQAVLIVLPLAVLCLTVILNSVSSVLVEAFTECREWVTEELSTYQQEESCVINLVKSPLRLSFCVLNYFTKCSMFKRSEAGI